MQNYKIIMLHNHYAGFTGRYGLCNDVLLLYICENEFLSSFVDFTSCWNLIKIQSMDLL